MASELVPARMCPVTSKVNRVYAPVTVDLVATSEPLTQTSAAPTTPLTIRLPVCPLWSVAEKSVRNHHGTENWPDVIAPFLPVPKQLFMFVAKNTLGHLLFCSNALISVPGAPASSGVTVNQEPVSKPGVEICAPLWVAVALERTFQVPDSLDRPWKVCAFGVEVVAATATPATPSATAAATAATTRAGLRCQMLIDLPPGHR